MKLNLLVISNVILFVLHIEMEEDPNLVRESGGPSLRKRSFSQPDYIGQCIQKRNSKTSLSSNDRKNFRIIHKINVKIAPFLVVNSIGELPGERYGHSACVDPESEEGIIFIFGGCNSNQKHFSDELFEFRISKKCKKNKKKPIKTTYRK